MLRCSSEDRNKCCDIPSGIIEKNRARLSRIIALFDLSGAPQAAKIRHADIVFSKLQRTDNIVLRTLMCVPMVKYEMLGLAAKYGLSDVREGLSIIRDYVRSCFVQKVQL